MIRTLIALMLLVSSLAAAKDDKPPLTREEYQRLLLGFAGCKLSKFEIEAKCPAAKALSEKLKQTSTPMLDMAKMQESLARELISNPAPAVRVKAAHLFGGITGTNAVGQEAITAAAAKEADTGVLMAFIRTASSAGAKNPKVAAMLLKAADHPVVEVRLQAVYALASSWNREMAGGAEKLLLMAQKDAEPDVRRAACEYAGALGNELWLPFYEKQTASADDKAMYTAAMKGLVKMFYDYPLFGTSSEKAWRLFLKRMNDKPRTESRPPWTLTSLYERAAEGTNKSLAAWKTKATWWNGEEDKKWVVDIVGDKACGFLARVGAVRSYAGLGATKAELEALKAKAAGDAKVLKAIDEAIAKLK